MRIVLFHLEALMPSLSNQIGEDQTNSQLKMFLETKTAE
jgi:hypothetical protein